MLDKEAKDLSYPLTDYLLTMGHSMSLESYTDTNNLYALPIITVSCLHLALASFLSN